MHSETGQKLLLPQGSELMVPLISLVTACGGGSGLLVLGYCQFASAVTSSNMLAVTGQPTPGL